MGKPLFAAFRCLATGVTVTTAATSAATAIPVDSAGHPPRYVRVAGTGYGYLKVGDASVVATTNDILFDFGASDDFINVTGCGYFAVLQHPSTPAISINLVPLEDA